MNLNNTQINLKTDTAANWTANNPTLGPSEIGIDRTNYEFKIGNGGTWNQTQNFIANNTTVKAIQSTANSAASTAASAVTAANSAASAASVASEWVTEFNMDCFPSSPTVLDEISNGETKLAGLTKIIEGAWSGVVDNSAMRVTDTVTMDFLMIFMTIALKSLSCSDDDIKTVLNNAYAYWKDWAPAVLTGEGYTKLLESRE